MGYNYTPIDIYIYKIPWNSIELIQYLISKDPRMANQFENKVLKIFEIRQSTLAECDKICDNFKSKIVPRYPISF